MKKILLLLVLIAPMWSLALDPEFELSNGAWGVRAENKYGINDSGIIVLIDKNKKVKVENGITPNLLKESNSNTLNVYEYRHKKINYRVVGIFHYTYDYICASIFTTPDSVTRALPEKLYKGKKIYINWPIILILLVSILSLIFLFSEGVLHMWFGSLIVLITSYIYIIEEFNLRTSFYIFLLFFLLAGLFRFMELLIQNKTSKFISYIFLAISGLLIIMPLIFYYILI